MRPLRYSINVSLDGCADHAADGFLTDAELHHHAAAWIERNDTLLFGRVTYELMEAWRPDADGRLQDWVEPWMEPFARSIGARTKLLLSTTRTDPGWNTEVVSAGRLDAAALEATVRALKEQPGEGIGVGGVALPTELARLGLIDEYQLVVHPVVVGRGPYVLGGLAESLALRLVDRTELASGATALVYEPAPRAH